MAVIGGLAKEVRLPRQFNFLSEKTRSRDLYNKRIFDEAHLFSTECVDRDDKSKCDVMKSKGECVHENTKWLAAKMCRKTCGYCGTSLSF